jgi:hypothetical protein
VNIDIEKQKVYYEKQKETKILFESGERRPRTQGVGQLCLLMQNKV